MATVLKLGTLARCFSTSSSTSQLVKAPIQVFGLEGRYATALYSAATKLKQLEAAEKDLVNIQASLKKDANFRDLIINPIIQRKVMMSAIKDTGSKMKLSDAATNLLVTLAENGRLKKLDSVITAFRTIMAAHRGEVVCEVTTAKPLDAGQKSQLEGALKQFLAKGETIQLSAKVDPTIIGGLIVSIGDKYVDMSIASKVKKYEALIQVPA